MLSIPQELDFSSSGLVQSKARAHAVDFTLPLLHETAGMTAPASAVGHGSPATQSIRYTEILPKDMWVLTAATTLVLGVSFAVTERFVDRKGLQDYVGGVAFASLLLLQLGGDAVSVSKGPAKILYVFASILAFVIFSFYTCALTSRQVINS